MRNWNEFIAFKAEKIYAKSLVELRSLLERDHLVSKKIGRAIDLMLNNLTTPEVRDGVTWHVARNDPVQQEWEATFSAVNMGSVPIVTLTCQGYYLSALTLIRQELEGIAQLNHILHRSRTTLKAPKMKHLDERLRSYHSVLSEAAHLASNDIASLQAPLYGSPDDLALLPHGSSILPCHNSHVASEILELHISLREELLKEVDEHIRRNGIAHDLLE